MEYYSAIKNNKALEFDRQRMNTEDLLLSEASQAMKERHCCLHLTYTDCLHSTVETERLENVKVLKIVMDTRDKVERECGRGRV